MNERQPHWKMAVDIERCIGCHACSVACKVEHDVPLGIFRTKVYYLDEGTYPKVKRHFLPTLCMQCEDPPCLKVCPTEAIVRGLDGIVRIIEEKCDGIGLCERACPYGAIFAAKDVGAVKCDFCSNRLEHGLQPACVETCPAEVLVFGDANDPASPVSQFLARHGDEVRGLKPEEGTRPAVGYRGHHPEIEQKIPRGRNHNPESYEMASWASLDPEPNPHG